ncbi:hypothetical protein LINPERPRIM_LOCUS11345 [Linum perenne]
MTNSPIRNRGKRIKLAVSKKHGPPKGKLVVYLSKTTANEMTEMVAALGVKFDKDGNTNVDLKDLKDMLYETDVDVHTWSQMYVLFLMGSFICPKTQPGASMQYATFIQRRRLKNVVDYNWCSHVADQLHEGMVKAKIEQNCFM